jgi:carbon starvation protein CstA
MKVIIILGVLFLALLIIIPLVEKSNMRMSDETTAKISKWIWPLMIVLIALGAFKAFL